VQSNFAPGVVDRPRSTNEIGGFPFSSIQRSGSWALIRAAREIDTKRAISSPTDAHFGGSSGRSPAPLLTRAARSVCRFTPLRNHLPVSRKPTRFSKSRVRRKPTEEEIA